MNEILLDMIRRLDDELLSDVSLMSWGAPIPFFGNIDNSKIATLGLNPSNKEYVDNAGLELSGNHRRFHTLNSLGIDHWSQVQDIHLSRIIKTCEAYFQRNPYNGWFKKIDHIISGTGCSYYYDLLPACHLDLIPYATSLKWTELSTKQQLKLLYASADFLGMLLQNAEIELLVLNGQTVVDNLEKISNTKFDKVQMDDWTLPRRSENGVRGYAYTGVIYQLGSVDLKKPIQVVGYNHNLQSSYGVTTSVQHSIRSWITTISESNITCDQEMSI